ncbi:MAG: hypothetical protein AB7H90_05310 [Alphaproteobacteria bacterium]
MEQEQKPKHRLSKMDTSRPIVRNGKIVEVTPTEWEEQHLFPILDERLGRYPWAYQMLPRSYIHALLPERGRNKKAKDGAEYLRKRLPKLSHEPNNYLRLPQRQTDNGFFGARTFVYAHADTALNEDNFWHDLMAAMIACQIEIGVRETPGLQLVNFERIINMRSMPKDGPRTWTIEIPRPDIVRYGKTLKLTPWRVTPDWQLFGIATEDGSRVRWYCGIEADRGTEPSRRNSNPRKSLQSMVKRMLEIDRLGLAKTLFGLPALYFPIVCNTPQRMATILEIIGQETDGLGNPRIIVKDFPVYNSYRKPPEPNGEWFKRLWKRVAGNGATWSGEYRMDQL